MKPSQIRDHIIALLKIEKRALTSHEIHRLLYVRWNISVSRNAVSTNCGFISFLPEIHRIKVPKGYRRYGKDVYFVYDLYWAHADHFDRKAIKRLRDEAFLRSGQHHIRPKLKEVQLSFAFMK